jgi:branched-chain amino acid transport system substrate-binding protein
MAFAERTEYGILLELFGCRDFIVGGKYIMSRVRLILGILGISLAAACQPQVQKPVANPSKSAVPTILVGVAGPMSGELSAFGEQMKLGAEQAVADINAWGGLLGKKLALAIGGDSCDPKQALAVAENLVSKGVVLVAGHFCSGASIPASSVYRDSGILQITPASTNPRLTENAADWGTVFRTCGRDDEQAVFAGTWMAGHYKGKNVAIVNDRSIYGKSMAGLARTTMNQPG